MSNDVQAVQPSNVRDDYLTALTEYLDDQSGANTMALWDAAQQFGLGGHGMDDEFWSFSKMLNRLKEGDPSTWIGLLAQNIESACVQRLRQFSPFDGPGDLVVAEFDPDGFRLRHNLESVIRQIVENDGLAIKEGSRFLVEIHISVEVSEAEQIVPEDNPGRSQG